MTRLSRAALLALTTLAVLMFVASGGLMAATADCTPSNGLKEIPVTVQGHDLTIITPETYDQCPIQGCCDTITVTGVPAGYKVVGQIVSSFVFTTMCMNNQPAYAPTGRSELETINLDNTPNAEGVVTIKVCYPNSHSWPSFETHVDLFMDLMNVSTGETIAIVGSGADWDTFCRTVGCTPGKWKNWTGLKNQPNLWPTGYNTGDLFATKFGKEALSKPGLTLLDALATGGGGEKAMVRHCTAALLNAAWTEAQAWSGNDCQRFLDIPETPGFDGTPTVDQIIQLVQDAYDGVGGVTFDSAHQQCAGVNESMCALDGVWLGTDNGVSECAPDNPGNACNQ